MYSNSKLMQKWIFIATFIIFMGSFYRILMYIRGYRPQRTENAPLEIKVNKPLFYIGILSKNENIEKRNIVRNYVIQQFHTYKSSLPFVVQYNFFLDSHTNESNEENMVYNDIVFMNISIHGYMVRFGYKLQWFYKYVAKTLPDVHLIGRMDDDVFLCVDNLFSRLKFLQGPNMFYGYKSKFGEMDEQLFVIGKNLLQRIAKRDFCEIDCNATVHLLDHRFGTSALHLWLKPYKDVVYIYDNQNIFHCIWRLIDKVKQERVRKLITFTSFCKFFVSFHKADGEMMKYLYQSLSNDEQETLMSPDFHSHICYPLKIKNKINYNKKTNKQV